MTVLREEAYVLSSVVIQTQVGTRLAVYQRHCTAWYEFDTANSDYLRQGFCLIDVPPRSRRA